MTTKVKSQKGIALVTVLVLMALLSLIGATALFSSNTGKKISSNYRYATDALQNADAGISDAARQLLNTTIVGNGNTNWNYTGSTTGFNNNYNVSYVIREDNAGNRTIAKDSANRPYYQVVSTGYSSGAAGVQRKIKVMVKMIGPGGGGGGGTPFDLGVFGDKSVTLGGNGSIDSYNSTKGPYGNGNKGDNGNIATNAIGKDVIDLNGVNAKVYGGASVGPGGNPGTDINDSKGGIQGPKGALSDKMDMTPKNAPDGGIPLQLPSGATTLTEGTYRVDSINLSGTSAVTIVGDVTLIVESTFKTAGQSQILISNGASLTLYVAESIDMTGQGIVNQSQNPGKVLIYGTDTCTTVKLAGNADLYAALYAPKAAATTGTGNGSIFGSVVAMTIKTQGNGSIHYDESLKNPVGGGGGGGTPGPATSFKLLSWKEL